MVWAMSSAVRVAVPLKSMCSTKCAMPLCSCGLVARAAGEPHADADRAHVRHPLREEAETIREDVADDRWLRHRMRFRESAVAGPRLPQATRCVSRKSLTDRELEEHAES